MKNPKTVVRAEDYYPEPMEYGDYDPDSFHLPQDDLMLLGIFGDTPDYSKAEFEKLWQMVINADDSKMISYCLVKGIDVKTKDGKPVPGWRDIAVMLKAIDTGHLKLDITKKGGTRMNTNYNEPHKAFRDKWFHGNDRELLRQGQWDKIDLGTIPEQDLDGRVRQGYLAECAGDVEAAQAIYDSIGFDRVASDDEGELLDTEAEHYG